MIVIIIITIFMIPFVDNINKGTDALEYKSLDLNILHCRLSSLSLHLTLVAENNKVLPDTLEAHFTETRVDYSSFTSRQRSQAMQKKYKRYDLLCHSELPFP